MPDAHARPPMPRPPIKSRARPADDAAHIITRLAIALLLIGVPVASVMTVRAVYVLVPIGAALSLVAWLLAPGERGPHELRSALFSQLGLVALFFVSWAGVSLIWTPFAIGPSERFVKSLAVCALVAAAAALLPRRTRTANLYLLPIGVGVGAVAIIILALVDGGASRRANPGEIALLPRITLGLTLLVWPALGALSLRRKPKLGVWLGVVMVIAVLAAQTPLALGASAFGCLAFAAAMADQRIASRIAGFLGALIILGSPIFCWAIWRLYGTHAPHVLAPAALWGQFLSLDDLRALSGHGFDSARLGVAAGYLPPNTPRSALFEIWFELGLVGALGAALLTLWIARGVERMRADIAPVFLGGLTSAFTLCSFGLGVSMVWWVTLLALFAFAFALLRHGHARTARPRIKSPPR